MPSRRPLRTLIVDNHDSFTHNIFQMVAVVNGVPPIVVRNDAVTWEALRAMAPDNVIISPGPGRPDDALRFGVSADVIRHANVPVLGVCLGHQGIAVAFGAQIVAAPSVMHGRRDEIIHDGTRLFDGIPSPFAAVRYHSLCVREPPAILEVTARSRDGVIMALQHRSRPLYGVQFHPESIASEHGMRLFENFARLADPAPSVARVQVAVPAAASPVASEGRLHWRRLERAAPSDAVFAAFFAGTRHPFWLDSSLVANGAARFSFMGNGEGPLSHLLRYDVGRGRLEMTARDREIVLEGSVLAHAAAQLQRYAVATDELPFEFQGGYVGYLGYEMKAECGGTKGHASQHPDAQLLFADRLLAFDHESGSVYLVCVDERGQDERAAQWLFAMERRLSEVAPRSARAPEPTTRATPTWRHDAAAYRRQFVRCQAALQAGDTYEICLTNQMLFSERPDALALHLRLREDNPAPYAALLGYDAMQLVCSSPERFLSIDRQRNVETRPIKGTARRGATPEEDDALAKALAGSEKNRAENLMIVDVLRNDLGRVCEVGSVHVTKLMDIEHYATVHQMVSTVRGRLRSGVTALDAVRAMFPGGSMTGAPKLRTMELLDELEAEARGPYSGALGYLSLSGAAELAIVIRTVVIDATGCSVGVGGAITVLSDVEDEMEEAALKGAAPRRAIGSVTTTATSSTR